MKQINLLLLLCIPFLSCSQKKPVKKESEYRKVYSFPRLPASAYHDSIYVRTDTDTTFGMIQFNVGNGTVKGSGCIVEYQTWEMHETSPEPPTEYMIKWKDTVSISFGGGIGFQTNHGVKGLIKTKNGYKKISEQYQFIPD